MAALNHSPSQNQQKQLELLQTRMRRVKNQMDFVEIISNFLPTGVMDGKVDQLEQQMQTLNNQFAGLNSRKNPFNA